MLGITKISSGRMGNRLFHYHFLRQISAKTGIEYFNIKFPDCKYFKKMNKRKRSFSLFRKQIKIDLLEINRLEPDKFLEYIYENNKHGYDIIFKPPILGEVFFDYLFYPPSNFIEIKDKFKINFNVNNKIVVGVHFRGTDFVTWNPHASLKFSYYKQSIDYCLDYFDRNKLAFFLFTDDLKFLPYLTVIDYLKSNNIEVRLSSNLKKPIYDFYQISQCDVLISSPSTFSVLAGAIGKNKKIIHSQEWLNYSISRNDKFWVDLKNTKNPYYSLWKAI